MFTGFKHASSWWDKTAELGLGYDTGHSAPGMRIASVMAGGPSALAGSPLTPCAVILAVDGQAIASDEMIYPLLNHKAGQLVSLSVRPSTGGDPVDVALRPAPPGSEIDLLYNGWVERRRAMVERLSNGRLAYAHV